MLEATVWGFLGGFAMLVGAFIGFRTHPCSGIVGRVMAFGAGTLVCAVTLELTVEAFDESRGGCSCSACSPAPAGTTSAT